MKNVRNMKVKVMTAMVAALTVASSAAAQSEPFFVSAGYTAGLRSPAEFSSGAAEGGPVHGIVVGAGVSLTSTLRLEASVTFETGQSLEWYQGYAYACCTRRLFSDRDVPVLGFLRYAPACDGRWCAELVVGGGFNLHSFEDVVTEYCGPIGNPASCTPVSVEPDASSRTEPAIAFGVDIPIRVSPRWTVGPSIRFLVIVRDEYATGWKFRGPRSAGSVVPMFGVTATWLSR